MSASTENKDKKDAAVVPPLWEMVRERLVAGDTKLEALIVDYLKGVDSSLKLDGVSYSHESGNWDSLHLGEEYALDRQLQFQLDGGDKSKAGPHPFQLYLLGYKDGHIELHASFGYKNGAQEHAEAFGKLIGMRTAPAKVVSANTASSLVFWNQLCKRYYFEPKWKTRVSTILESAVLASRALVSADRSAAESVKIDTLV